MDPEEERLELEPALTGDDDLPVEHAAIRERGQQRRVELRKVAIQRLQVTRLDVRLVAVAEDDRPEAVPLRLEEPAVALRQAIGRFGQHRLERRQERQSHFATVTHPGSKRNAPSPPNGRLARKLSWVRNQE